MKKFEPTTSAKGVIVIVHGALEHHGRYWWLVEMWRTSGFYVIIGDLPGQGLTSRTHRGHVDSFNEYTIEIESWLAEAAHYGLPIFLFGHSMGGLAVIRLLQTKPVNVAGIILSSPCLGLAQYPPVPVNALAVGLNWIAPELKVRPNLSVDLATRNEDVKERALNDSLYVTKVSVRWYRELLKAMKQAFSDVKHFPDVPLLVLQGGDDKIVDKHEVIRWFNLVASTEKLYKEWLNCYHEIFNEPEREIIFTYALNYVETRLYLLGKK